jgi:CYTH domain-containing protein
MIKKPELSAHETVYKRIFLLEELPAPLARMDEHWQIFDDYTAWPEFRLRQIRVPHTREWFRMKEEIQAGQAREEISRTFLPGGESADNMHSEKEIRKNRYFYEGSELVVDVFLGKLWGLILAQINFKDEKSAADLSPPGFALIEVSDNRFFRGECLVEANFDRVRAEFERLAAGSND